MLRRLSIGVLLYALLAAPAWAQATLLMPGVTYERQVQFTSHGPVVIHVLTAPKPGGLYALKPVLSNAAIVGRETVTAMQRRISPTATVAGVNGDLFNFKDGHPSGVLMQDGVMASLPLGGRSSIGLDAEGNLHVDRVAFFGTWYGNGQRRPLSGLNRPPGQNEVSLFTPAWGPATPPEPEDTVEAVLFPFAATVPNADLAGPVTQIGPGSGGTPIPAAGAVLVARGGQAGKLAAEAPVGTTVTARLILQPEWTGIVDALGGGPVLVRDGKPVFRADELFATDQLVPRHPRTAVGQLADGRLVLVAVDGRQPGYSAGMTSFELAQALARLGAVTASALDSGGSTTMAFEGALLNRPSDPGGERPVAEALLVLYYGVYAPPPASLVLSPNGDGVAERQALSYKVVRPSSVTESLVGPDEQPHYMRAVERQPGVYPLSFGAEAFGSPPLEGHWTWSVTAVDDQGIGSAAERTFSVDTTLGYLTVEPPTFQLRQRGPGRLRIGVDLAHPARLRIRVETGLGVSLATLADRQVDAGDVAVLWNGRDGRGRFVHSGRYAVRVTATGEFGTSELTKSFLVRRRG